VVRKLQLPGDSAEQAGKPDSPGRPGSAMSGEGDDDDFSSVLENDSVRVLVRVRPSSETEQKQRK
jgi:hypothetical protein